MIPNMRYIYVDTRNLQLSIGKVPPKGSFIIPVEAGKYDVLERGFHGLIYNDVLYPYRYKQDRIAGISGVKYKLFPPDPWLIAICAIMWQGLIQGMTWDLVKHAVQKGISILRINGLAPREQDIANGSNRKTINKNRSVQMSFSWTVFAADGKPRRELFLGVKREYMKKTQIERETIKDQYKQLFHISEKDKKSARSKGKVKKIARK
jgi:hypothetical protein